MAFVDKLQKTNKLESIFLNFNFFTYKMKYCYLVNLLSLNKNKL